MTVSQESTGDDVERWISGRSARALAAQLMVVHIYGARAESVTEEHAAANTALYGVRTPAEVVGQLEVGGVALIGHLAQDPERPELRTANTDDPERLAELTAGLQAAAATPLLVAVDQEQGAVNRIGSPLTTFPGAMALGASRDPRLARRSAAAVGDELAALGVNVDLAPVADVNVEPANPVIGTRSFGGDPSLVARMVAAQVVGYQDDAGIAATAKHFPGHGDTRTDSHVELPVITHDRPTLDEVDLPPFRAAIEAEVELVMPGHLLVPDLDPHRPAPLSPAICSQLLRGELGFRGTVISDSLWMRGVRGSGTDGEVAVRALLAGIDILLMPPYPEATLTAIEEAVEDRRLPRRRLEEAVRRVLGLKRRLRAGEEGGPTPRLPDRVVLEEHAALSREIGRRAVTHLAGPPPPPLSGAAVRVVGVGATALAEELARRGVRTVSPERAAEIEIALVEPGPALEPAPDEVHRVAVLLAPPTEPLEELRAATVLATFSAVPDALRGLAEALLERRFEGTAPLPVVGSPG